MEVNRRSVVGVLYWFSGYVQGKVHFVCEVLTLIWLIKRISETSLSRYHEEKSALKKISRGHIDQFPAQCGSNFKVR